MDYMYIPIGKSYCHLSSVLQAHLRFLCVTLST